MMIMISVVIPAFNEEKALPNCLDSLCHQTIGTDLFEVIVVNNNSTDSTAEQAQAYANRLNIRVADETTKGRGPARSKGFVVASGDIILSTDSDTIVPDNWIESMVAPILNGQAIATTGGCWINDCPWLTNLLFNSMQPLSMRLYRLKFGHYWLSGFSFAITRLAYEQSGGFDLDVNAQEDTLLAMKVANLGKIHYLSKVKVLCSGRRFKNGFVDGIRQYVGSFKIATTDTKRTQSYLSDVR